MYGAQVCLNGNITTKGRLDFYVLSATVLTKLTFKNCLLIFMIMQMKFSERF